MRIIRFVPRVPAGTLKLYTEVSAPVLETVVDARSRSSTTGNTRAAFPSCHVNFWALRLRRPEARASEAAASNASSSRLLLAFVLASKSLVRRDAPPPMSPVRFVNRLITQSYSHSHVTQ